MTKKEKLLTKFSNITEEASFREATKVLEILEYKIIRTRGSHFIFRNQREENISIPVHNNRIKKKYVRKIQNLINKI